MYLVCLISCLLWTGFLSEPYSVFIYNYSNFQKYEWLNHSIKTQTKEKKKKLISQSLTVSRNCLMNLELISRLPVFTKTFVQGDFHIKWDIAANSFIRPTTNHMCNLEPEYEWIIEKWKNFIYTWWCVHLKELNIRAKSINSAGLSLYLKTIAHRSFSHS